MKPPETTKILVVDDEPHICEILCRYFSAEGYQCTQCPDGTQAMRALDDDDFDLLVADIIMPGMNGIDLLNIVGRLYPDVAVLMVTAVDDRDTGILAIESGAYGYITKPFRRNDILVNVAMALQRREAEASRLNEGPEGHHRPQKVSSSESSAFLTESFPDAVHSGLDDIDLVEEFDTSDLGNHVGRDESPAGREIVEPDWSNPASLSPETVDIDLADVSLSDGELTKPVINALDAVNCIRSGMSDRQLMKRYQISEKGLRSLLKKLFDRGCLTEDECPELSHRYGEPYDEVQLQLSPRYQLAVLAPVYDPECHQPHGQLQNVNEQEIGIIGIEAHVGETRTLVIPAKPYLDRDHIWLEAQCCSADETGGDRLPNTSFHITTISDEHRANLRELVRVLNLGA